MYIRATGMISPQNTFMQQGFPAEIVVHEGDSMRCVEPDYKELLDPRLIRRMSRIIRFGSASAMNCLKNSGWENVDAIITGTAYGCLEDTSVFLSRMIENNEQLLTPTAFIQSTHNTIGAQIGLSLKNHCYNNTFVHRAFSFEHALTDAWMLFCEKQAEKILVGAADEITNDSQDILRRFRLYRNGISTNLIDSNQRGTMSGEGAAFFALSDAKSGSDQAEILGIQTFLLEGSQALGEDKILSFLNKYGVSKSEISLLLLGKNGDVKHDEIFDSLRTSMFEGKPVLNFKQYCGEYPTASAFGLWMATDICRRKSQAGFAETTNLSGDVKILLYNVDPLGHHSLMLVSSC